jgi:hypothetical protein
MNLRITEAARAAGVNKETLRYYERRGLLDDPVRSPGGHRLYGEHAVQTLRIIKAAQRLGFTLGEVADLLQVGKRRGRTPGLQDRARDSWSRSSSGWPISRPSAPTWWRRSTPGATTCTCARPATAVQSRSPRSPAPPPTDPGGCELSTLSMARGAAGSPPRAGFPVRNAC